MKIIFLLIGAVVGVTFVLSCQREEASQPDEAGIDVGPSIVPSGVRSDEVEITSKSVSEVLDGEAEKE